MNFKYLLLLIAVCFLFTNCKEENKFSSNVDDYNQFIKATENEDLLNAKKELFFWTEKIKNHPEQYVYLSQIARYEGVLFEITGDIIYLKNQEERLLKLNNISNNNNAGYLRALSKNYITQHRFKEALNLLKIAKINGESLVNTQKMLFDVYLELGDIKNAEEYLNKIKNFKDFDYLIRLSKWNDFNGDLSNAIFYMEKAKEIAEEFNNTKLKQWVYTNIADYYGHAGRINDSYDHYLRALHINPGDTYSKKGIAWILFSYEHNTKEALRIINSINYQTPDYLLFKAEIAAYNNNVKLSEENKLKFIELTNSPKYGVMYDKYKILLFAEDLNEVHKALEIAKTEVKNRPTTQSYDLLAWSYYLNGNHDKAIEIINKEVLSKTKEPEALFHIASVFSANDLLISEELIQNLQESVFELGPLMAQNIEKL
ncbi:MAG: cell surface protein [Flavobacterium sp.]|nr:MAG: cell surface protein [Flavobacterium sp.]